MQSRAASHSPSAIAASANATDCQPCNVQRTTCSVQRAAYNVRRPSTEPGTLCSRPKREQGPRGTRLSGKLGEAGRPARRTSYLCQSGLGLLGAVPQRHAEAACPMPQRLLQVAVPAKWPVAPSLKWERAKWERAEVGFACRNGWCRSLYRCADWAVGRHVACCTLHVKTPRCTTCHTFARRRLACTHVTPCGASLHGAPRQPAAH
jgi:hypothetical protein